MKFLLELLENPLFQNVLKRYYFKLNKLRAVLRLAPGLIIITNL